MSKPLIAVTMGDPAGVGPELCLRVLCSPELADSCVPVIFGDAAVLDAVAARCGLRSPKKIVSLKQWLNGGQKVRNATVVDCEKIAPDRFTPGAVSARCGAASFAYIKAAIRSALAGRVAGVATAPIHKEAWSLAGIAYPGHTEAFGALTRASRTCMLLYSRRIACSFVTTHTSYASVPAKVTRERVVDVLELSAPAIETLRGRPARLTVCGLNPHAGEHGLFGRLELAVLQPAIEEALGRGLAVEGPISPDAAFLPKQRKKTDCFVCMYHDQGHIPFKMLAFDTGVNITLGLSIVRTSVDHGTAFDIAWTGRASESSLLMAVQCARKLAEPQTV